MPAELCSALCYAFEKGSQYIALGGLAQYADQAGLKLIDYPISHAGIKSKHPLPGLYFLLKLVF